MITTTQERHFKMQLEILDNKNDKNWDKACDYINKVICDAVWDNEKDLEHYMRLIMGAAVSIGLKYFLYQNYYQNRH